MWLLCRNQLLTMTSSTIPAATHCSSVQLPCGVPPPKPKALATFLHLFATEGRSEPTLAICIPLHYKQFHPCRRENCAAYYLCKGINCVAFVERHLSETTCLTMG